jgi:hypothetical protein
MSATEDYSNSTDVEAGNAAPKVNRTTGKSSLAVSDNPFAPRKGKALLWRNVNMTLVSFLYYITSIVAGVFALITGSYDCGALTDWHERKR